MAATIATHNEVSVKLLLKWMAEEDIAKDDERLSCIHFLVCVITSHNLSHYGYRTAKYVPYGPLFELLPYLSRRADENSSVQGQVQREIALLKEEISRRSRGNKNRRCDLILTIRFQVLLLLKCILHLALLESQYFQC